MKVILFGATGMVGQGVLRECLRDDEIEEVRAIGRRPTGVRHPRLRELQHADLLDYTSVAPKLGGYDACLYCLGVSSAGMCEAEYRRITLDGTLAAARVLATVNPAMTFIYVSGAGTDSSERGRTMWARVKGETENALLGMPFRGAWMMRPGYIQPLHGVVSRTRWLRVLYALAAPLYPLWKRLFPGQVTTTEELGQAMVRAAKIGTGSRIVECRELADLAAGRAT